MEFWENLSQRDKASIYGTISFILLGIGIMSGNVVALVVFGGLGLLGLIASIVHSINQLPNNVAKLRAEADRLSSLNHTMPPSHVGEDQFPDLNETFTYQRETRVPPREDDRYPNLDESFTYGTRRSPSRRVPLSYQGQNPTPEAPPPNILEVRGHSIYQHAFDAMEVVNGTLDKSQPLPIDMGLIVYRGTDKPAIYRTHDVPDDADSIQPYVQLHVPLPLIDSGSARVRFEIVGSGEKVLFSHEQAYTLKDNLNLITPPARLAISELDTSDLWELRLSVGDKLLAQHLFAWGEAPTEDVITALEADGEISDEIRHLLEEQAEQPLSLADLLMQQEDDEQKQQGS